MGSARATILVVDDDPSFREALHLILDRDYVVLDAVDGADALATLASRRIDLVLLDLVMPRADGFEVLEQQRQEDKPVPIIVLSALNTASTAAAAMRLGAVDYVTKPFDDEMLLALVRDTFAGPAAGHRGASCAAHAKPLVLCVGVDLGLYSSLVVLLRRECRVVLAEGVVDALALPSSRSATVLVVDLAALGQHAADAIVRLGAHLPNANLVTIDAGRQRIASSSLSTALEASAHVTDLLAAIYGHLGTSDVSGHRCYSRRVACALDHLGLHYTEGSVRRLARTVGTSPDHLAALFREETGLPLKVYITELRVEVAKWLLIEAGDKVEAVAARVGLHDASHLSKLFVRYAGIRPGAYRRGSRADPITSAPAKNV